MINKFQKLTPARDIELGIYEEALTYAFSEEDIRNIAISGAYGAGKSSVIESYERKHPQRKFLHISLAHFEETVTEQGKDGVEEIIPEKVEVSPEVRLEGKILNQLIHQVDPDRIPLTNFKVKREADVERLWGYTWWCAGFCVLLFFILFNKQWCELLSAIEIENMAAAFLTSREAVVIAGIALLGIAIKGMYSLIRLQSEKKLLKKISLQGNDIEILEDCNDSYFDRYLNEVLYLFEHVDADAIVFEDIDRFGTNTIFEKLREINTLVGKRRAPLRFIYLLKDDIFESSDRAKFFDFIIPVVPVIDASNSYEIFMKDFKEAEIFELFSEEFLQGLSLFIDDMRILKNIENEFLIYKGRFEEKPIDLNWDMLLAMITYKNLFPKDFGELQLKRGYVYTLFESKDKFRKEELWRLDTEIDRLKKKLQDSEAELCQNMDELNALFFKSGEKLRVNGKGEEQFASRADFVAAIMKHPDQVTYSHYSSWYSFNVKDEIDRFQNTEEYKKRKSNIEAKASKARLKIQVQISKWKEEKSKLESAWLKNIITRENAEQVFGIIAINPLGEEQCFEEVKRSPYFALIQYLIMTGYIDETYSDYMTYFYENSISAGDKKFLRGVMCEKAKPYQYSLQNPKLVINKLKKAYFEEEEVLNFDLLDCLIENSEEYKEQLFLFLKQIIRNEPAEFVGKYLQRDRNRRRFTDILNLEWEGAGAWILSKEGLEDVRKNYVVDTLCVSSADMLAEINQDDVLKEYIESHEEVLEVVDQDVALVMQGIQSLGVKIKSLDYGNVNKKLFEQIYQNNVYELNPEMVNIILEHVYHIGTEDIYWEMNLTQIFMKTNEPLTQYVEAYIGDYIKVVLEKTNRICDIENIVLHVLNHVNVSDEEKCDYIDRLETSITHISEVENSELWEHMMKRKLVQQSAENMCDYYFQSGNGMDEYLVDFINGSRKSLTVDMVDVNRLYGDNAKTNMLTSVVCCNDLEDEKYEKLVKSFHLYWTNFTKEGIAEDKMRILVRNDVIRMSKENLTFLRSSYSSCIEEFIHHSLASYMELIEESNVLVEAELGHLWKLYPTKDAEVNHKIQELAEKQLENLLNQRTIIPFELLQCLLGQEELELDDRKKLLAVHLGRLNYEAVLECLRKMKLTKYIKLLEGKRPGFGRTDANKELLTAFVNRGWISSFSENPQDPEQYKAYGKKKRQ